MKKSINSRNKGKVGERELGFPSLPQDGFPKSQNRCAIRDAALLRKDFYE